MTGNHLDEASYRAAKILEEALGLAAEAGTKNLCVMAVTKNQPPDRIEAVRRAGFTLFGENRVQEFLLKKEYFDSFGSEVHLIGHLQSNKVNQSVGNFSMIQSVDSVPIAARIGRTAEQKGICQDVLLEVNAGNDPAKYGFLKEQLYDALDEISGIPGIRVKGLMTIPPIGGYSETAAVFKTMRKLFVDIECKKIDNVCMEILSMGMSGDYKSAIREGANLIRLGTILFG